MLYVEKQFAVIGNPIKHSLSPAMHNAGYETLGINAEYQRFRVEEHCLEEAVKGLRALGFAGWNVTLPHKEAIVSFMDTLTPEAEKAGAVNTVKNQNGRLIGHNTDGKGFVRSVENDLRGLKGKKQFFLVQAGPAKGLLWLWPSRE